MVNPQSHPSPMTLLHWTNCLPTAAPLTGGAPLGPFLADPARTCPACLLQSDFAELIYPEMLIARL